MAPLFSLSLMFTSVAALLAPRAAIRSTRLMAEPPIGDLADRLLSAKEKSGKTFDQIADELGFTNTYTTQLLLGQAQLKPETLPKLKKAVPGISAADLVDRLRASGTTAMHAHPFQAIVEHLEEVLRDGDLVVVMGAGPVWQIGRSLVDRSSETSA